MTSRSRLAFSLALAATLAAPPYMESQQPVAKPDSSGYIAANGIDYWFEIRGKGEPLLLLHGGLFTTELFGPVLTKLAENRQVIGVHLQGHGRTALGTRKINLVDIGRDLGVVVEKLGLKQVDVMGYSFGGGAAFQLAAQRPELVRRLVLVSTPYAQNGFFAEMLPQQAAVSGAMADQMKQTPMYTSYAAVAPRPQDFPKLLDAMGEYMRQPYDWSASVKKLTMPVMLVYGDADMIRPEHYIEFYKLLGGGLKDAGWMREHMSKNRLAILPDLTHYEVGAAPILATTVLPFLNGQTGPKS
jgi:pimeloyl-ACP methyl ester carboxylesterase